MASEIVYFTQSVSNAVSDSISREKMKMINAIRKKSINLSHVIALSLSWNPIIK